MGIGIRLKEERKSKKMTQEDLGLQAGTTKKSIITYEKEQAAMPSSFLEKLAPLGFDIQYIVTGVRSNSAPLTPEEKELVRLYNEANQSIKLAVMATLTSGVKAGHVVNVQGNIADNISVNVE